MEFSDDVITKFGLVNENTEFGNLEEDGRISNFIIVGTYQRQKNKNLFDALGINSKCREINIYIKNVNYFYFFDDNDRVNNKHKDAPYLEVTSNKILSLFPSKIYYLSKQDMITISKFLIRYYEDIISDLKRIEKEI